MLTITELYTRANDRIYGTSRLSADVQRFAMDESFTDQEDHLRWLLTATLAEIRDWAEHCIEAAK